MKAELLKQPVLWADETTVNVLDVEKSTCYMWVYGCGLEQSTGPKLVLFDYQDSRSSIHPTDFLAGLPAICRLMVMPDMRKPMQP